MPAEYLYTIVVQPRMGPIEHAKAENQIIIIMNRMRLCVKILLRGLTTDKYLCMQMTVKVKIDDESQNGMRNALN